MAITGTSPQSYSEVVRKTVVSRALPMSGGGYVTKLASLSDVLSDIYGGVLNPILWRSAVGRINTKLQGSRTVLSVTRTINSPKGKPRNTTWILAVEQGQNRDCLTSYSDPSDNETYVFIEDASNVLQVAMRKRDGIPEKRHRPVFIAEAADPNGDNIQLIVSRPAGEKKFSNEDREFANLTLTHFKQAMQLKTAHESMCLERNAVESAMEKMGVGIIYLEHDGSIRKASSRAIKILNERDGLQENGNKLWASKASESRDLQNCIGEMIARNAAELTKSMLISRPSGRPALSIAMRIFKTSAVSSRDDLTLPTLFVRDPSCYDLRLFRGVISQMYGLTVTESSVAILIAMGYGIGDAGRELGIKRNTVRTHLRGIYGKLSIKRQSMLARILFNSVIVNS